MSDESVNPHTVTVSPVAAGLAYVYGRVVRDDQGGATRWEYLGSSASREDALERARRTANGGPVWDDERDGRRPPRDEGIGTTRPPADS